VSESVRNLLREFWSKWLLWLVVWTVVALCFGHQSFIHLRKAGTDPGWWKVIHWSLEDWYVWGLFSMGIFEMARRYPLQRDRWLPFFALHGVLGVLTAPVYQAVRSTVCGMDVIAWRQPLPDLLVYWIILTVWQANHWRKESHEEAMRAANLERQMVEAQLLALRMQLNPHFLFNTLNAIATLLRHDLDAAERMLVRLSELLRRALDTAAEPEVALNQELDFVERYVEIEQLRFGDRLQYVCDVPAETRGAMIPNLILQPLVENAIKHGIENRVTAGRVEVRALRSNGSLRLEVRDNGKGSAVPDESGLGVGLTNTRTRLATLYGERQQCALLRGEDGCVVSLEIPFHTGDDPASPGRNAHAA
jgi:two-component system LytT family sensor kinase